MKKEYYFCDPALNHQCSKEGCFLRDGPCQCTTDISFAMKNKYGIPVIADVTDTEANEEMVEMLRRREELML